MNTWSASVAANQLIPIPLKIPQNESVSISNPPQSTAESYLLAYSIFHRIFDPTYWRLEQRQFLYGCPELRTAPEILSSSVPKTQRQLYNCLKDDSLKQYFPAAQRQRQTETCGTEIVRNLQNEIVKVFCTCCLQEEGKMIHCDSCIVLVVSQHM